MSKRAFGQIPDPLLDPLSDDMQRSRALATGADEQFGRRTLVRATFAHMEAFLYQLRGTIRTVLVVSGQSDSETRAILAILFDEVPRVDHDGTIQLDEARIPFAKYCTFIIKTLAECYKVESAQFFGNTGWRDFRKGLDVRHRITHPKLAENLTITQEEIDLIDKGCSWLISTVKTIMSTPAPAKD
jgi:hypothetical protein